MDFPVILRDSPAAVSVQPAFPLLPFEYLLGQSLGGRHLGVQTDMTSELAGNMVARWQNLQRSGAILL